VVTGSNDDRMSVPFLSSLIGWLRDICSGAQRRVREFFLAETFYYQARITQLWNGSKEEKEISEERRLYRVYQLGRESYHGVTLLLVFDICGRMSCENYFTC